MGKIEQKQQAFKFIDEQKETMVNFWQKLVNTESGSADKEGVEAVATTLKNVFEQMGASTKLVEFEKAGSTLVAEFNLAGDKSSEPGILFLGHMDTVFSKGTIEKRPFTITDGKAYGPGALDMKGGITVLTHVIKALQSANYNASNIKVILAGDEEVAHINSTAKNTIIEEARGCIAAFNFETGYIDEGLVVGRKGSGNFTLEVQGVAAHAGNNPEKGRNAIIELSHKMIEISKLADWERGLLVNVGVVQGGNVPNAVPDYAKAVVDVRYTILEDFAEVEQKIRDIAAVTYIDGTTTTVSKQEGIASMETTEGVRKLFALVAKTSEENNFPAPYEKSVGGGSDSAYTVIAGVPTVCAVGVKGENNHSPKEYAVVDSLFERTKLITACVLNLAGE